MSQLLARLACENKVTDHELTDNMIMMYYFNQWLDNGIITNEEHDLLNKEVGF